MSWLENLKMHDYTGMRARQQSHKNALGEKGGDNYDDTQKVSSSEEESDADDADLVEETKGEESPGLFSQAVSNVGNAMNAVKGAMKRTFDF